MNISKRKAVVIGATGLVGTQLVNLILADDRYDNLIVVTRRSLEIKNSKLQEVILEDFERLEEVSDQLVGNDYFCALGTTMKKAGSKELFLKVDLEFPLKFASIAKGHETFHQFLIVSALGANSSSFIFYNRTKGKMEEDLKELGLSSSKIFQPSLLLGDRKEFRLMEEVAKVLSNVASFFTFGSRKRIGAIYDVDVAGAMVEVACENEEGFERYSPSEMIELVDR